MTEARHSCMSPETKERLSHAETILKQKFPLVKFRCLGSGMESVVLTDEQFIYKVFDNTAFQYGPLLTDLKERFHNAKRFIIISDIIKIGDIWVLKYDYGESSPYTGGHEDEIIEFLLECKQHRVTCWNVKPENFRIFNDGLKFIDLGWDIKPYYLQDYIFMAQRAFLTFKYPLDANFKEIARKALLDREIDEPDGFPVFFDKLYNKFITTSFTYDRPLAYDICNNLKNGPMTVESTTVQTNAEIVSLVIKACYQDGATLYRQVKHIVSQCERPRTFFEKIVVVDPKKDGFLRQYAEPSIEKTYFSLERLKQEGFIDEYITASDDEGMIRAINKGWFGIDCPETHNIENIPVSPQLYAFEIAKGDYILQTDSDVLVARRDKRHDYIGDMISALRYNSRALSVGFNIAHDANTAVKEYTSPGNGEYKPEVRFCMIDKKRMLNARPFPNELDHGKLKLSWYGSVRQYQKDHDLVSLRGGDPRTFYIHPPNTYKKDTDAWFSIIDKVERGDIPPVQFENFDLTGTYMDWHGINDSKK